MDKLDFVPYGKRYHYPHMMPKDREIWERFINENPNAFDVCAYDVAVGEGTPMNTIVAEDTGGDINRLYQRKIDVVAKKGDYYFIIELKPRAGTGTIGQVKGYTTLFKRDFGQSLNATPIIITDELLSEMDYLAKTERVAIYVA